MSLIHRVLLSWLVLTSAVAFLLFAWDKFRAGRPGASRVSELSLLGLAAIGGWLGGWLAMLMFRHKTAKLSFKLKYAFAFPIWGGLLYAALFWLR